MASVMKAFDLKGKTALITGGSRGAWDCKSPRRLASKARAL